MTDTLTMQALLKETGEIVLQYQDASTELGAGGATGIKNADGSDNLTVGCWSAYLSDGYAVEITQVPGIYLSDDQAKNDLPGADVTYTMTVTNVSGTGGTITIACTGNTWDVNCPASIDLDNGETDTFDVTVTIPGDASNGDLDTVNVSVSKDAFSDDADLTTTATIRWTLLDDVPTPRGDAAGALAGRYIFFMGGVDGTGTTSNLNEIYDIVAGTWSTGANMTTALYITSAAAQGGHVYIPGGFNSAGTAVATNLIYHIGSNQWTTGINAPSTMGAYVAVSDGTYVYRIGGSTGAAWPTPVVDVDRYDPVANTWSPMADMPAATMWPMAAYLDGKIYVAGGLDGVSPIATLLIYDVAGDSWSTGADLPEALWGGGGATTCNLFYVFGGITGAGTSTDHAYSYDPTGDAWSVAISLNQIRFRLGGAGSYGRGVYAIGGYEPVWTPHPTFEKLDGCGDDDTFADDDVDDDADDDVDDDVDDDTIVDDDTGDDTIVDDDTTDDDTVIADDTTDDDTVIDDDTTPATDDVSGDDDSSSKKGGCGC